MSRSRVPFAALAGVIAGGLTLGVAEVVAAVVSPTAAPILAVGSAFIDLTPPALKNFAVENFGTNDKLVLLVSMAVVIALLSAVAGVVSLRNRWAGRALVVLLGVVAAAAALTRASAGPLDALPSILGVAAGLVGLNLLMDRIQPADRPPAGDSADSAPAGSSPVPARRSFLAAAGITAALAAVAGAGGRFLGQAARNVSETRANLNLPAPATAATAVPAAATAPVEGLVPFVTPNADFYRIDTALTVPNIDPATWRLRVHGMVENEIELTYQDLVDGDLIETWLTLTCVSNEIGGDLVGNAKWLGLPIRDVLARAKPTGDADMVLSMSEDGWKASTPLEVLQEDDRDALFAIAMNDEPLPLEHGFPVRMVVPGLYGFVSATKWVTDIEVTRFADATAYWTDRGWSDKAPIKTACRLEVPGGFAQVPAGTVAVGGTAWAQHRGITAVEVRVDEGEWQPATLADEANLDTWRQWSFQWEGATPGPHTLTVRATDGAGEVQTQEKANPIPNGASGWHSRQVTVT